jgi:hypothetical protein
MSYTNGLDDPSAYFKVKAYAGDGNDGHAITFDDTDTNMQPDLVWMKGRTFSDNHTLYDSVRGANKYLHPDTNSQEYTNASPNFGVKSFDSDGFTLGQWSALNRSSENHIAWCWKTQGGAGSSNEAGSINTTSTSVNTTSKFSISTYTGTGSAATIGHGLGAVPHWIMCKERGGAGDWVCYHHKNTSAPETDVLEFNNDTATADNDGMWNDTAPTSTLITLGGSAVLNNSSDTYVCYAWSGVQGFSRFGSYNGNANADGPFVYTGFRPAWIMIKNTQDGAPWMIMDNKRSGYNPTNNRLYANTTATEEGAVDRFDILSNGFKIRTSDNDTNKSGDLFIYAAFAEQPLVNSNGVPCNAR